MSSFKSSEVCDKESEDEQSSVRYISSVSYCGSRRPSRSRSPSRSISSVSYCGSWRPSRSRSPSRSISSVSYCGSRRPSRSRSPSRSISSVSYCGSRRPSRSRSPQSHDHYSCDRTPSHTEHCYRREVLKLNNTEKFKLIKKLAHSMIPENDKQVEDFKFIMCHLNQKIMLYNVVKNYVDRVTTWKYM